MENPSYRWPCWLNQKASLIRKFVNFSEGSIVTSVALEGVPKLLPLLMLPPNFRTLSQGIGIGRLARVWGTIFFQLEFVSFHHSFQICVL